MLKILVPISLGLVLFFLSSCSEPSVVHTTETAPDVVEDKFVMPSLPKTVDFCEEQIELDNFDIRERLDKELIVNTYYHSSTIQAFKRSNRYFPLIERVLEEENVPEDFKYLCLIESGLTQAVSPSGAKGFWQFMPATGKEYGLRIDKEVDQRLDIEKSTRAACAYLKDANEGFNDWMLTAAAYNRGVGGIKRDLESQDVERYFDLHLNNETSRYVFRILALKLIFENPEGYGFQKDKIELYAEVPTRSIEVKESIPDLIKWAKENGSNYHMLKVLNPWLTASSLKLNEGNSMAIKLPKN
jgi:hypothetical protein